jgi:hypothetical protein
VLRACLKCRRRAQPGVGSSASERASPRLKLVLSGEGVFGLSSRLATVSFQVTILKVLAGQPEGKLSIADLRHNVAILISSGPDWTDRTKRIAARTPGLDIFSQGMVLRSPGGWQITDAGRAFLASCEVPISSQEREPEAVESIAPLATSPAAPLVGPDTRRKIWVNSRRREKKAARSSVA